ncbi:MAG: hypothetical protein R2733_10670 [Acidimicrobiales bacterium]
MESDERKNMVKDMCDRRKLGNPASLVPVFLEVESVFMPDFDQSDCAWCEEALRLDEIDDPAPVLAQRIDHLALGRSIGIPNGVFLSDTAIPPLGPYSIIVDSDREGDIALSTASAVQTLRSNGQLNLESNLSNPHILDPNYYLGGRFSAQVVVAAILRSARASDLRTPAIEDALRDLLAERLAEPVDVCLHLELLLAAASGRLPEPGVDADSFSPAAKQLFESISGAPF